MDDSESISGHFNRINQSEKNYFSNNYYQIIQVHLLAEKEAIKTDDEEIKKLDKGLRMEYFWNTNDE